MNTFPVKETDQRLVAFEIENVYITINNIIKLLGTVPGVENIRRRSHFSSSSDVHVNFEFDGVPFIVLEPFGDNSRYWIGPEDPDTAKVDAEPIRKAFDDYAPSPLRKFIGDVLTLRFLKRQSS